jgi:hypothetical protein
VIEEPSRQYVAIQVGKNADIRGWDGAGKLAILCPAPAFIGNGDRPGFIAQVIKRWSRNYATTI